MATNPRRIAAITTLALAFFATAVPVTRAAQPATEHSGRTVETFVDDFIFDLCGIETTTTVTERWTLTTYADGSQRFRVSRTFISADPRLPIESGAGMSYWTADGIQTVTGTPIRLRRRGGGIVLLDAGRIVFGEPLTIRGPHPSLGLDLAQAYCP